jgi:hypothetical protein
MAVVASSLDAPYIRRLYALEEGLMMIDEADDPEVDESLPPGDDQPEYDEPGEDADESRGPHNARA